jgi:hypothetical protein
MVIRSALGDAISGLQVCHVAFLGLIGKLVQKDILDRRHLSRGHGISSR